VNPADWQNCVGAGAPSQRQRAAQWLDDLARDSGLSDEVRRWLYDLVMVTRHDGAPTSAERFDEYDRQVRREYRYVPQFVYRPKRRQVLESFLARGRIYTTAAYFDALEQQARANLRRAINRLD
jgi:hypothetical protein